jgi:enoyl-CoA hydratase/carnithine racemase
MDELVLYATDDRVGMVTLNRPSKLNAINAELREQLVDALRTADADPSTSVVILRAEGRSFCAGFAAKLAINRGADVGGFHNAVNAGLDIVAPLYAARTEVGQRLREITRKDGLGAALKWRAAQFAE